MYYKQLVVISINAFVASRSGHSALDWLGDRLENKSWLFWAKSNIGKKQTKSDLILIRSDLLYAVQL